MVWRSKNSRFTLRVRFCWWFGSFYRFWSCDILSSKPPSNWHQPNHKTTSKWHQGKIHTWQLKPLPCQKKTKPPSKEHLNQMIVLQEFEFSRAKTKSNINQRRLPTENDINMHTCYYMFWAQILRSVYDRFTIDSRSIWHRFVSLPFEDFRCSFDGGSMEDTWRFDVGFMEVLKAPVSTLVGAVT